MEINNGKQLKSAMTRVDDDQFDKISKLMGQDENLSVSEATAIAMSKDPEKKKYLILYYMNDSDNEEKSWELVEGRTNARKFIKDRVEYMDIHNSIVVAGTVTLIQALEANMTVYEFMKQINRFFDDSFDIEDYNNGDENKEE